MGVCVGCTGPSDFHPPEENGYSGWQQSTIASLNRWKQRAYWAAQWTLGKGAVVTSTGCALLVLRFCCEICWLGLCGKRSRMLMMEKFAKYFDSCPGDRDTSAVWTEKSIIHIALAVAFMLVSDRRAKIGQDFNWGHTSVSAFHLASWLQVEEFCLRFIIMPCLARYVCKCVLKLLPSSWHQSCCLNWTRDWDPFNYAASYDLCMQNTSELSCGSSYSVFSEMHGFR